MTKTSAHRDSNLTRLNEPFGLFVSITIQRPQCIPESPHPDPRREEMRAEKEIFERERSGQEMVSGWTTRAVLLLIFSELKYISVPFVGEDIVSALPISLARAAVSLLLFSTSWIVKAYVDEVTKSQTSLIVSRTVPLQ